jgi:membrane-associated phospholipid phosphatase
LIGRKDKDCKKLFLTIKMANSQDVMYMKKDYTVKLIAARNDKKTSQCLVPMTNDLIVPNYQCIYSKGLPHPDGKTPDQTQIANLVKAIRDKDINLLYQTVSQNPKLVDVYCILDSELLGRYKSSFDIGTAPSPLSVKGSAELLEVYAMNLLLDVKLSEWSNSSLVSQVIAHLNLVSQPLQNKPVTVDNLFRGDTAGDLIGPYVSQFLYQDLQLGSLPVQQKYQPATEVNYMNTIDSFLSKWSNPIAPVKLSDGNQRYLITLRDCANYIHLDQIWQPFFTAAQVLFNKGVPMAFVSDRPGAKFINLGPVDLFNLMTEATKLAMNSAWMWKYCQLKMRPEEMAYQVHLKKTAGTGLDFPQELLTNPILQMIFDINQNYLLPQVYPEGSPAHPSYPSGHATIAGAMGTILKAFFNVNHLLDAKVPNEDGSALVSYPQQLKVGDEIDKLVSNCGIFRNVAGIHYRSDVNGHTTFTRDVYKI